MNSRSWRKAIRRENHDLAFLDPVLAEHFDAVEDVLPLDGGHFSNAYAFSADGRAFVLRINQAAHAAESFSKDEYAGRNFASPGLPIPRIVAHGKTEQGYYAIGERVAGRTLMDCTLAERRALLPALLDTLDALGAADTSASSGYGDWDGDGAGRYTSWPAFLAEIDKNHDDGFYLNWHRYFDASFLERDVFDRVYQRMVALAAQVPNLRQLVHNDYQFENILTDGERMTGVIDWANALYGDPLYDVAWLNFISIHPGWWFDDGNRDPAGTLWGCAGFRPPRPLLRAAHRSRSLPLLRQPGPLRCLRHLPGLVAGEARRQIRVRDMRWPDINGSATVKTSPVARLNLEHLCDPWEPCDAAAKTRQRRVSTRPRR